MKVIQSSIIRAIVAIAVGVLLVMYREETTVWITIVTGVLFFISGCVSCILYFVERDKTGRENDLKRFSGETPEEKLPTFPFVGIGSIILGIILAVMPGSFITWVVYILAAILILGAINQFVVLASARRFAHVPVAYWFFPVVTLCTGIFIIAKPMESASFPLKIIGWCMMFYGVVELLNAFKIKQMRRTYNLIEQNQTSTDEELDESVAVEEKTESTT